jgi:GNAT superfamily N-acetyltransferase
MKCLSSASPLYYGTPLSNDKAFFQIPKTSLNSNMNITIRPAGKDDLDDIVQIVVKAFPHDDQFAYRYPYRKQRPEDHLKYSKMFYAEYLETTFTGQNSIMVAEAPDVNDPTTTKVIAMSIWDNPGDKLPSRDLPAIAPPKNRPERKDCNPKRMKAYSEATMKARKDVFVDRYGQRQLSLRQLATLPEYWNNRAGSKLLSWGMNLAREKGLVVPMFAGPMGKKLYEKHGFKELAVVHVQVDGEQEELFMSAMAWDPKEEVSETRLRQ